MGMRPGRLWTRVQEVLVGTKTGEPPAGPLGKRLSRALRDLPRRWRADLPRGLAHWLSVIAVLGIFLAYVWTWAEGNSEFLFDPNYQNDDARTGLFAFHRYGPDGALADDPVANEMLAYTTIGLRLLYGIFVPLTDLYTASKLVQGVALGILFWAGFLLMRSKHAGLGAGVILVFFVLHDPFIIGRMAGGHSRAFAFPVFALWVAGAVGDRPTVRRAAPVLGALMYPTAMVILLAAEGFYCLRGLARRGWNRVARALAQYGVVVLLSLIVVSPALVGGEDQGPVHTLEQAKKEPAFGNSGRLWVLPFDRPTHAFADALVQGFVAKGDSWVGEELGDHKRAVAIVGLALVLGLVLFGFSPPPWAAIALTSASATLYLLSRLLAFRLYNPERYFKFGMRITAIAFLAAVIGLLWHWKREPLRSVLRNSVAALVLAGTWTGLGDGVRRLNEMNIKVETNAELYEFIRTLPLSARFGAHPRDADGIPYFGARGVVCSYETLQPWFVDAWKRQRRRAEDTLRALYATDIEVVLDYAKEYQVTHLLIRKDRYGKQFVKRSRSFEPLTRFARNLLKKIDRETMVMHHLPEKAIVFRHKGFLVVEIDALRKHWKEPPPKKADPGAKEDDAKARGVEADETKTDETKADETEADETKADETEADETEADEAEADETEAGEAG